jgi:hypothetical protein
METTCSECGLPRDCNRNRTTGLPVCVRCYRGNHAPRRECGTCHQTRHTAKFVDGVPHCEKCADIAAPSPPRRKFITNCAICRQRRWVQRHRETGKYLCGTCRANRYGERGTCTGCDKVRRIVCKRDGRRYCNRCYVDTEKEKETCVKCGHLRPAVIRRKSGPVCSRCYDAHFAPKRPCGACARKRRVAGHYNGYPICLRCWRAKYGPRVYCGQCGNDTTKRPKRAPDGKLLCHGCFIIAYWPKSPCVTCGVPKPYKPGTQPRPACRKCSPALREAAKLKVAV